MEERLNKLLSSLGVCSRREADRLIEAGEVLVDGQTAQMGQKVREGQTVVCQGRQVYGKPFGPGGKAPAGVNSPAGSVALADASRPPQVLLAVHKPRGVVCTTSDKDRAPNIVDMIHYPLRVYYVGRLDKESEGLVLMTNQGDLVNKIMRSGNAHEKEYRVTVNQPVTEEFLKKMRGGIYLKELNRSTLPCNVTKTGEREIRIVLTQGLNRQIRRMCTACGYEVRRLVRVRVMNIQLKGLKAGEYRLIEGNEKQEFLELLKDSTNQPYKIRDGVKDGR